MSENSLSVPPKNLKEAIDWVLRVIGKDSGNNGNEAIKGLAEELKKLFDKDAGEVARGVLTVMGKSITDLADKLGEVEEDVSNSFVNKRKIFAVLEAYLQYYRGTFENVRDYGSSVSDQDRDKLKGWLTGKSSGPIAKLAEGLGKLIGYQDGQVKNGGIGNQSEYKSAYKRDEVKWPESPDDKRTCALIFLGIAPILFYGLTYLYWQSTDEGDWKSSSFSGSSSTDALSAYLDAMGLEHSEFNQQKTQGSTIAEALKQALPELTKNANEHYPEYLRKLLKEPVSSTSPLSCCHLIASPLFTPNSTYDVQTASPVSPSFLGYSGLGALAGGAYGFNLGGLGTFVSALLA
ncbi:variant erythrocyte surface antigen-1 family protein [Babesia caballi]|uniref:Variant erythrocyte surface antigen-1 family protein n=1 Tax=Babesia caballi TaxID=5871 RepID=A0AAV4M291_BABCB|nr:variant erythrocyte surface antigen-1 family protein [Babesia caballi]